MIDKIKYIPPVNERRFDFNREELTLLELVSLIAKKFNDLVDHVNGLDYSKKEDSANITINRKLSPTGNFTGTLAGRAANLVLAGIDSNRDKIGYLARQFADGYTGQVIDGGFFAETNIRRNYDGGIFPRPNNNIDNDSIDYIVL